jgi:hypothetical protein
VKTAKRQDASNLSDLAGFSDFLPKAGEAQIRKTPNYLQLMCVED